MINALQHTTHFTRLVLYGLLGFFFSATLIATNVHAVSPTYTYSYSQSSTPSIVGNGFEYFGAAVSAACDHWIMYADSIDPTRAYSATSCSATETTSPQTFTMSYAWVGLYGAPPGSGTLPLTITKIAACPNGEQTYVFAAGDIRCRPTFCGDNVGKYTSVTVPTGTTGTSVMVAPTPPANICMQGCVGNNVGGYSYGLILDNTQTWSFIGNWRFTGVACADQPGLSTATGFSPPSNTAPSVAGASTNPSSVSTPYDQANSSNLGKVEANTLATSTKLTELKDAFLDKFNVTLSGNFTDCTTAATCTGDPHQCALAINARVAACSLGETPGPGAISSGTALTGLASVTDNTPGWWWAQSSKTVDVAAAWERPRWLSGTTCPDIPDFAVMGASFAVSIQPICDYANLIALIVIVTSSMIAYRIIAGVS